MSVPHKILRTPRWVSFFLLAAAIGLGLLTFLSCRGQGPLSSCAAGGAFALFLLAGAAESFTTSVRLAEDSLVVTSNFRRRTYPRAMLERVSWAGGVGVSLSLQSGGWVKLPYVGNSQSVTNAIRAWLKRTGSGP